MVDNMSTHYPKYLKNIKYTNGKIIDSRLGD